LRGEADIYSADLLLPGLGGHGEQIRTARGMPPARMELIGARVGETGRPTRLDLVIDGDWELSGLRATALAFDREQPPGSGERVSTVRQASGRFVETGRAFEVESGDRLLLDGVEASRLTVRGNGRGLEVLFQGTVDRLRGGPEGFVRDLTPSWLEYLYKQEQVAVLWGALVFLWGLAWKLRGLR
jgi:hypothetical protein